MRLCNAPGTFHSLMNFMFYNHINDFVVVYIGYLLVYSKNKKDHFIHPENVLSRLQEQKLFVGKDKYHFMTDKIEFLGLQVSSEGI